MNVNNENISATKGNNADNDKEKKDSANINNSKSNSIKNHDIKSDSIKRIEISVRDLVEFTERSGDIDNRSAHTDPDAMAEGARLHRKIQKEQGSGYSSEVTLKIEKEEEYDGEQMVFAIEGRADGIFEDFIEPEMFLNPNDMVELYGDSLRPDPLVFIDEIKTTYRDVEKLEGPGLVHLAQAKCYAFIYSLQNDLDHIGVRMSYANLETEDKKFFYLAFSFENLKRWFEVIIHEYAKWIAWQIKWERKRNASIKQVDFPFCYREGQKELAAGVYRTILRKKKLFLEAPTGVGKTISTVFPAVKAMGEGLTSKIFYGTAKTIARTVAEETFGILMEKGMKLKAVTITAKEKICVLPKLACNPDDCPRAKGHFDRVNDCVYDMLTNEDRISRELILAYAEKYNVCPFEMCLDVATWADAVICDYNYLFDPNAYLRRFFSEGIEKDYIFLIDEAHNLVERAREMYSARLTKEDFLIVKKMVGSADYNHKRLSAAMDKVNKLMLEIKRQCDEFAVWEELDALYDSLQKFMGIYEAMPTNFKVDDPELLSSLYLEVRHFVNMYTSRENNYSIYSDYSEDRSFVVTLCCMDPSKPLKDFLSRGRSAIFFSATLIPVKYYMSQLGGSEEDYAVYAPSPFDKEKRLILVGRDVSTKYTRRGKTEYDRIAGYIRDFAAAKQGNYMVFFPSYRMMLDIADALRELMKEELEEILIMPDKPGYEVPETTDNTEHELQIDSDNTEYDVQIDPDKPKYELQDMEGMKKDISESCNRSDELMKLESGKTYLLLQSPGMREKEKETFLRYFDEANAGTLIGFCVMGGIFGEGIDLRAERLIGAVIVGTGLPQVCNERELFRNYFDEMNRSGFEYAYLYNGMNKVLQSAGRVIRTSDDRGAILLLDERFGTEQYRKLFPQEWYPFEYTDPQRIKEQLGSFWKK